MTPEQLFDTLAVKLNADAVGGLSVRINFTFTDVGEQWVLGLANRALHSVPGRHDPGAEVTITTTRPVLYKVIEGAVPFAEAIAAAIADGTVVAEGDVAAAERIFANLDTFLSNFHLVEP
jgi:alkyl sulfatase BDS1-like metallo-beta-lactamase superfamily hydrolase